MLLLLITLCALHPPYVHSMQFYITANDTTPCSLIAYETCLTLQDFSRNDSNKINMSSFNETITLTLSPGRHFLVESVDFDSTTNVIINGQLENNNKPEITCKGQSCFMFHNLSSIHLENLVFTDCFSEDSDGGALFVSEVETVNITQCSFVNNFIGKQGGAIRFEFVPKIYLQQNQFVNNSAICNPLTTDSCTSICTASSGAISAANISSFEIAESLFEKNTALCYGGALSLLFSNITIVRSKFIKNSVAAASAGKGGALYSYSSRVQVLESIFEENNVGINSTSVFPLFLDPQNDDFSVTNLSTGGGAPLL